MSCAVPFSMVAVSTRVPSVVAVTLLSVSIVVIPAPGVLTVQTIVLLLALLGSTVPVRVSGIPTVPVGGTPVMSVTGTKVLNVIVKSFV